MCIRDRYRPQLYRGPNAVQHFWKNLEVDLIKIGEIYKYIAPIDITPEDEERLRDEVQCHICGAMPDEVMDLDSTVDDDANFRFLQIK